MVLGFEVTINTSGGPHFSDVPVGSHAFYDWIETAYNDGWISGLLGRDVQTEAINVTRGQLCKIVVEAAMDVNGWPLINPGTATFTDVPVGSTFFQWIETAVLPRDNQRLLLTSTFRPGNNATRAQISKIASLAIQNAGACNCVSPTVPNR